MNRNLFLLVSSQVFAFTAANVTVFLSGIIGSQLTTIKSLSTLPPSIYVIGIAISTIFAAKIMSLIGRRLGFVLASAGSSLASLIGAYSIFIESLIIFCFACFVLGVGMAFVHQYRFAAAESVEKDKAPKAISILLLAGIVSVFIGISLANQTKNYVSDHLYVGSYLMLAILTLIPAFFLFFFKNQNEVLTFSKENNKTRRYIQFLSEPKFLQAITSASFAYVVMAFLMTATPISMYKMHGFTLGSTSIVIQSHIIGMFLPSLITGSLIKKYGHSSIIYSGAVIYFLCIFLSFYETRTSGPVGLLYSCRGNTCSS